MKSTEIQPQMFTINTLYANGWTIRQAAKKLDRSYSHVASVLRGDRKSAQLVAALQALPPRPLILRESLAACK